MKQFVMCDECEQEYHDPLDRRFHAQPNACPKCGPHLEFWSEDGQAIAMRDDALRIAANAVRAGQIVALKGLGGFQLIVDARNEAAVVRLRERKGREEKPFALMYPSLSAIRADCDISEREEPLLLSPESPIVLVGRSSRARRTDGLPRLRDPYQLAKSIAPGNPNLGVMLPYSPLHHLLTHELKFPIVATSGNLSDEPICIDERYALQRLHTIADLFLVHDRPIVRHVDDSVVRIMCGREMLLRRARGYAPLPIAIRSKTENRKSKNILAVGAHLKNTVALKIDDNIFVSQHIGDLETKEAYAAFRRTCADLPRLYDANIDFVTCDMHPDYLSTKHCDDIGGKAGSPLPAGNVALGGTCLPNSVSSITGRTPPPAWRRIKSKGQPWVWFGTEPATVWTGPSGAANFCSPKATAYSNAWRISDSFDYRGAIARLRSHAVARWDFFTRCSANAPGIFCSRVSIFRRRRNRCLAKC